MIAAGLVFLVLWFSLTWLASYGNGGWLTWVCVALAILGGLFVGWLVVRHDDREWDKKYGRY